MSRTLTTGLTTETVATGATSLPAASDTCWNQKPTSPAPAITQNCQPPSTSPRPSACHDSTTGFISVAATP